MKDRAARLAIGLAILQLLDATGNAIVPRRYLKAHLDHLGVPDNVQHLLPAIKVTSSAGLLVGVRMPRVGALTAAALVAYYAAAARFHLLAGDHPANAVPAALFGASAAAAFLAFRDA